MKLLVHFDCLMAERAISILGLDREQWKPCGYLDMLGGQRLEQIVVVWSDKLNNPHVHQWLREDLPLKLPLNKHVEFL